MKAKILILGLFLISSFSLLSQESKKILKETDIVYVKSGGGIFHLENCGRLKIGNKSILKMTFADAIKKRCSPCQVCIPLETQKFIKEKYSSTSQILPQPPLDANEEKLKLTTEPQPYLIITKPAELYKYKGDTHELWSKERIPVGTELRILDQYNYVCEGGTINFLRVNYVGLIGWVMKDFCKIIMYSPTQIISKPIDEEEKMIQGMLFLKLIDKIKPELNEVWADSFIWANIKYEDKEHMAWFLAKYCGRKNGTGSNWIEIKDIYSGKIIAKYDSWGFKVY